MSRNANECGRPSAAAVAFWRDRACLSARGGQGEAGAGAGEGAARAPWRSAPARGAGLGFFFAGGGLLGRRRPAPPAAIRQRPGSAPGAGRVGSGRPLGRGHHPHRNGLRLIAGQREAHGEFVGRHRQRAGGPAGLAERGLGLGAGRLGLELHGGCRGRRLLKLGYRTASSSACWSMPARLNAQAAIATTRFMTNTVHSCGPTAALH